MRAMKVYSGMAHELHPPAASGSGPSAAGARRRRCSSSHQWPRAPAQAARMLLCRLGAAHAALADARALALSMTDSP